MSRESAEVAILKSHPSPASTMEDAGEEVIYVESEDGDRRNPLNYSRGKKWAITLTACLFTAITGDSRSPKQSSLIVILNQHTFMTAELHCTELQTTLCLGLYALGFGVVPLVTSSFSEEVGRRPVYIFSTILFTLTQVMVALAPNIGAVIAGRVLECVFGSTGASLVGGSIADIRKPQERGMPMSLFAFSSLFSIGFGSVIGGVIESEPHLGWRWVQCQHDTLRPEETGGSAISRLRCCLVPTSRNAHSRLDGLTKHPLFMAGVMIISHVAFLYLADCYNIYASSAQAGQSLFRFGSGNTMALVFPLLAPQTFTALTYRWGLTLVRVLVFLMAPTPFVLFFYGLKIRACSIASRQILATDAQASEISRPRVEKV
ncbi:hypothetical protein PAXINDRAFT_99665 [Paxillus involutus ATCC 200175]|uniref:Major facilitator superfamily (MFS) profile domain-containing protein n=1 Tax=Paxillus involutus ATCC 200175 TaxID=664439 RepID=A0A0C9U7P1_PAXIN|nr:hypothetical protein PAXINDRAFT_99665 [Paxillus involutus ATCC 200175]